MNTTPLTHDWLRKMTDNVPSLGEGGDFNHKCQCVERMLNMAVNVERSTAPPLLPNVCYTLARLVKPKLKLEHGKKENKKLAGQLNH